MTNKKTIHTLVEDIYGVFENHIEPSEDQLTEFSSRLANLLKDRITEVRSGPEKLRLSQIGNPNRKIWYGLQNYEKKPLDGQTLIKFLYGDIVEELVLFLAKVAGHEVTDEQLEVDIEGVKGHQDCRIDGIITDVKSASGYGFRKFKDESLLNGNDPFGYIAQISSYVESQGEEEGAFLAFNKENAELKLNIVHSLNMINAEDRVKELQAVAAQDTAPPKCYSDAPDGASGNRVLDIGCVWCDYKVNCWSDANDGKGLRIFNYAKGNRYFTHVAREPNVPEVKVQ
jgi:hypothetical protein